MSNKADILAQHYQKTFELTLATWEKRNRTFLSLLAVVAVATLLTFNVQGVQPILVDVLTKLLAVQDQGRMEQLRGSFPFAVVQSVLLLVVFYLTLQLYHRTATIKRHYEYMAKIETELRSELELGKDATSFTREGDFYANNKPELQWFVRATYAVLLGSLLLVFLSVRTWLDFTSGNAALGFADLMVGIPTLVFFFAYVRAS